ncbi:MAG: hypothetical protein WCG15_02790 [Actinomycetes bacterium]
MTLSKKVKPFMTYLDDADYVKLKKFAKSKKVTMARILREGLEVRMAQDNPYLKGFNDGLNAAINVINANQASQMRFPSGQSFGELINTEIHNLIMREVNGESSKG